MTFLWGGEERRYAKTFSAIFNQENNSQNTTLEEGHFVILL